MAKLAVRIDFTHVQRHPRYGRHPNAQPGEDTRVLPSDGRASESRWKRTSVLHDSRQDELDSHDDRPTVQRSKRSHHHSRDVTDAELVAQIKLPVHFDKASAVTFLEFIYKTAGRWDDSAYNQPPDALIKLLMEAQPSTYALGTGGMVVFFPIAQGDQAVAQFYIWDPMWMNRTELLKSVVRHAMRKWDLRRVTEMVPAANLLGCRNAEKIGFVLEGTLRENLVYTVNGVLRPGDMKLYGLLRSEVEAWQ